MDNCKVMENMEKMELRKQKLLNVLNEKDRTPEEHFQLLNNEIESLELQIEFGEEEVNSLEFKEWSAHPYNRITTLNQVIKCYQDRLNRSQKFLDKFGDSENALVSRNRMLLIFFKKQILQVKRKKRDLLKSIKRNDEKLLMEELMFPELRD